MIRQNPFRKIYDSISYKSFAINSFPDLIDIELTNYCNLNCKMCNRQRMTRVKGFMDDHTFEKIADECIAHSTPIRLIGWGEPFLHPHIIDFCKYYKNNPFHNVYKKELGLEEEHPLLHITNNGHIINEEQMKELVALGLDSIIFSFQGANKIGYEAMRVGASYDKIRDNILQFVKIRGENEKPFIQVSSTMTNETPDEIRQFTEYWQSIVDYVSIGKTILPIEEGKEMKQYSPCTEVFHKLTIKWDGRVSACCNDFNNTLTVDSLGYDKNIYHAWNGEQIKAIRTLLINNNFRALTLCKECDRAYENFL
jgi:MoaA/NifB/PqqE/SkfB family radical SAM enzyme